MRLAGLMGVRRLWGWRDRLGKTRISGGGTESGISRWTASQRRRQPLVVK
jgi:hypothetical protein